MRIDFFGLAFETPAVTVYMWSPWRASALEHRLFEAVRAVPGAEMEESSDERRLNLAEPKSWKAALQALARVLKGWQEEADAGTERRIWRWMLEADVDNYGYDHAGELASLWIFLRVSLDRGGPGEDKGEDIDLDGFGIRIAGANERA
ncbi:hypothetical protein AYO40_03790 [Planctomycetaceae bacterium SCGC AG-212-D15]|nr:hypothetical protein AYO40_03790 [Planctomycetaceae bacterium SCGC AG-212-D15]